MENLHNDSENWKWGIFYYNKNDKRLFPPKRNPWLGYTVNFANARSIFALLILIAIIITITELSMRYFVK
ncbi:DUF5808 domain-containing protein [Rhizosphaericola mali]|uniref:DUF5808 domain-containing protein n=1 Tax=Rhizosphaericola mali TaxID=2545455 RepID=A0A5P2FWV8_9BACT|nr:DUF5808 domain-containing protein [Rhizosphaericola mali]QES87397.1 hypothetical protein E0W69_001545 [Rhizosphaericola mali]